MIETYRNSKYHTKYYGNNLYQVYLFHFLPFFGFTDFFSGGFSGGFGGSGSTGMVLSFKLIFWSHIYLFFCRRVPTNISIRRLPKAMVFR